MIHLRTMILAALASVCLLGSSYAKPSFLVKHHSGLLRTFESEVKKASRALTQMQDNSDDLNNAALAFLWAFPLVNSK